MSDLDIERLIVGDTKQPTGITLYDTETGKPQCLQITDREVV